MEFSFYFKSSYSYSSQRYKLPLHWKVKYRILIFPVPLLLARTDTDFTLNFKVYNDCIFGHLISPVYYLKNKKFWSWSRALRMLIKMIKIQCQIYQQDDNALYFYMLKYPKLWHVVNLLQINIMLFCLELEW